MLVASDFESREGATINDKPAASGGVDIDRWLAWWLGLHLVGGPLLPAVTKESVLLVGGRREPTPSSGRHRVTLGVPDPETEDQARVDLSAGTIDAAEESFGAVILIGSDLGRSWRSMVAEAARVSGGPVVMLLTPADDGVLDGVGSRDGPDADEVASHLSAVTDLDVSALGWLEPGRYALLVRAVARMPEDLREEVLRQYVEQVGDACFATPAAYLSIVAQPVARRVTLPEPVPSPNPAGWDDVLRLMALDHLWSGPSLAADRATEEVERLQDDIHRLQRDVSDLRRVTDRSARGVDDLRNDLQDHTLVLSRALDAAYQLGDFAVAPMDPQQARAPKATDDAGYDALRRRLNEAHAARREAERLLRDALNSESLRVGKAVTAPARWVARAVRRIRGQRSKR